MARHIMIDRLRHESITRRGTPRIGRPSGPRSSNRRDAPSLREQAGLVVRDAAHAPRLGARRAPRGDRLVHAVLGEPVVVVARLAVRRRVESGGGGGECNAFGGDASN
jgi:hypothetical protein